MLAKVHSGALVGLEGALVEAASDLNTRSLLSVTLVSLPDAAGKQSIERVRSAIFNFGLAYPRGRLIVNFAPADLRRKAPRTIFTLGPSCPAGGPTYRNKVDGVAGGLAS